MAHKVVVSDKQDKEDKCLHMGGMWLCDQWLLLSLPRGQLEKERGMKKTYTDDLTWVASRLQRYCLNSQKHFF